MVGAAVVNAAVVGTAVVGAAVVGGVDVVGAAVLAAEVDDSTTFVEAVVGCSMRDEAMVGDATAVVVDNDVLGSASASD